MKRFSYLLGSLFWFFALSPMLKGQTNRDDLLKLSVKIETGGITATGIVVGENNREIFIITAKHVLSASLEIQVSFYRDFKVYQGTTLPQLVSKKLDLAVILVRKTEDLELEIGRNWYLIDGIQNRDIGTKVSPVGYSGVANTVIDGCDITNVISYDEFEFERHAVSVGFSGGPVFFSNTECLVGMTVSVHGGFARAINIIAIKGELDRMNLHANGLFGRNCRDDVNCIDLEQIYQELRQLKEMIKQIQEKEVGPSCGIEAINSFTNEELEEFEENNIIESLVRNLKKDRYFLSLVSQLKPLEVSDQNTILICLENTFKPTFAQLGKISCEGQTDAGQKAERAIAEAVSALIKEIIWESNRD